MSGDQSSLRAANPGGFARCIWLRGFARDVNGQWLALEVGTDGLWNHVDRDIGVQQIATELEARLAQAFVTWAES